MSDNFYKSRKEIKKCVNNYKILKVLVVIMLFIIIFIILSNKIYNKSLFIFVICPILLLFNCIQSRDTCDVYINNIILSNSDISLASYYIELLDQLYSKKSVNYKIRIAEYHLNFTGDLETVKKCFEELNEPWRFEDKLNKKSNSTKLTVLKIRYNTLIGKKETVIELIGGTKNSLNQEFYSIRNWLGIYSSSLISDFDGLKYYLDNVTCYSTLNVISKAYYLGVYYREKNEMCLANKYFSYVKEHSGDFNPFKGQQEIDSLNVNYNVRELDLMLDQKIIRIYNIYYLGQIKVGIITTFCVIVSMIIR